jgi:dipeptidyl aminopeptidase/acylaminoacyl peptidase
VAWLDQGRAAFGVESREEYPGLWLAGVRIAVPQAEPYDDLRVTATRWRAPDGLEIEGLVYDTPRTRPDAPLLVQVHGGPAAPIEEARGEVVGYRHLLRAGYRVLKPAFRGSLGYGDRFSQANIGCQGRADLADILAGVDHLAAERCGILGRSYGGYMALRALAVTRRFRAGVAISGFVDNRWMTLETGDLTYEREYLGPVTWPVPGATRLGDVFPRLAEIASPLLLIHGEADPICPLSQARVAYRAVQTLGGQVGLVVYPGEGHRIADPEHQRDCARRVLAFFREFLPVD